MGCAHDRLATRFLRDRTMSEGTTYQPNTTHLETCHALYTVPVRPERSLISSLALKTLVITLTDTTTSTSAPSLLHPCRPPRSASSPVQQSCDVVSLSRIESQCLLGDGSGRDAAADSEDYASARRGKLVPGLFLGWPNAQHSGHFPLPMISSDRHSTISNLQLNRFSTINAPSAPNGYSSLQQARFTESNGDDMTSARMLGMVQTATIGYVDVQGPMYVVAGWR